MVILFTLFLIVALVVGLAVVAREVGKSQALVDDSEDTINALHKSIDEAQEADEIRRKAAADTLTGRMSRKYYRD